jgi:hypothetical protein
MKCRIHDMPALHTLWLKFTSYPNGLEWVYHNLLSASEPVVDHIIYSQVLVVNTN